jgi:hypothetical protein
MLPKQQATLAAAFKGCDQKFLVADVNRLLQVQKSTQRQVCTLVAGAGTQPRVLGAQLQLVDHALRHRCADAVLAPATNRVAADEDANTGFVDAACLHPRSEFLVCVHAPVGPELCRDRREARPPASAWQAAAARTTGQIGSSRNSSSTSSMGVCLSAAPGIAPPTLARWSK